MNAIKTGDCVTVRRSKPMGSERGISDLVERSLDVVHVDPHGKVFVESDMGIISLHRWEYERSARGPDRTRFGRARRTAIRTNYSGENLYGMTSHGHVLHGPGK